MFIRYYNLLLQFLAEVEQIIPLNGSLTNYTLLHIGQISVKTVFSWDRVARSLVFCVMFYRSLFVLLSYFFWSLCCLSFFDLRLLVTASVSSIFSWIVLFINCVILFWPLKFGILYYLEIIAQYAWFLLKISN